MTKRPITLHEIMPELHGEETAAQVISDLLEFIERTERALQELTQAIEDLQWLTAPASIHA
ncbi:hypothetical protein [Deinococcus radiotolerans]|uniref:Uncharacterized protein n=1 Tax=Deinococcus radiotolerans TaxID=1309407 RepID=A0ABQ2FRW2_9DEIO|nr:hypothetical protein [Deinococcus radiotolerans]GGL20368.1 hypothetical protein GCM10010844_44070 [Deinococcus radiotolerans]